jgi:ABC-type multidrug transport system fused ATPase/permease subunit
VPGSNLGDATRQAGHPYPLKNKLCRNNLSSHFSIYKRYKEKDTELLAVAVSQDFFYEAGLEMRCEHVKDTWIITKMLQKSSETKLPFYFMLFCAIIHLLMQTLIHADIFFFVTTIAVVLVTLVAVIVLIYIIFILKDIRELSRTIKKEGQEIMEDVHVFRQETKEEAKYSMKNNSSTAAAFFNLIANLFARRKSQNYKK